MNEAKKLIVRADFWAAVVGLISVLSLALFGTEIDQEAILAGVLAIVGMFTGSQVVAEYREKRIVEEQIKADTEVKKAGAEVQVAKAYAAAPVVRATPNLYGE